MSKTKHPNNEEVRAWANERYYDVPVRGPLPQWIIEAWDKAHPKRKYVAEEAHHGTLGGYTLHRCRERCCIDRMNEYCAERRAA